MNTQHESIPSLTINVRRKPQDYRIAKYHLTDFQDPHWSDRCGGGGWQMNDYYICGYVLCDGALEGSVAHTCGHGDAPHRIKVCVTKTGNDKSVYQSLLEKVGPKPKRS